MKILNPTIKAKKEVVIKTILIKYKRTWPEWFNLSEATQNKLIKDESK